MAGEGRSVLVVDDDSDLCGMVALTLQSEGYRVITAGEGAEALAKVATEMPSAIVLDMMMPGMNGWEFAREFRARYGEGAPIMVLTAATSAAKRAQEIGAQGYLNKPFDIAELVQAVESIVDAPDEAETPTETRQVAADEPELVQKAVAGDQDAFIALYDRHVDRVYRYLYYRLGNTHDTEDLVQQVFLKAWENIASYRELGRPFSSWLLTIARNLSITFYRRRHPNQSLDDPGYASTVSDGDAESDPADALEAHWKHEIVWRALEFLEPTQRKIILLRFFVNLQHREVAEQLNRSEANVRVLQFRALKKLRQILKEQGYQE
jgi:RNA polymerase sigma factor (sigma-70 family)